MMDDDRTLPVHGSHFSTNGDDEATCSPKAYVSNEERAIAAAMRALRKQAEEVRDRLQDELPATQRSHLESHLEELRGQWRELAVRRDEANRRKMIMLGHIPPDDQL